KHARAKGIAGARAAGNKVVRQFKGRLHNLRLVSGREICPLRKMDDNQSVDAVLEDSIRSLPETLRKYLSSGAERYARNLFSLEIIDDAEIRVFERRVDDLAVAVAL